MIRLGVVPYLNALPLYRVLEGRDDVRVVAAVPSQLAPMLARGECDVALIPVVEHLRGVGDGIISSSCIGCTGAVRSVLLFHRERIENIQTVALDTSSRTSVALTKVVLHDLFNIKPSYIEAPPQLDSMLQHHDAALLIGDNALVAAQEVPTGIRVLDLGEAWHKLTGLSFVFAAWVSRHGLDNTAELATLLDQAREVGVQQAAQIAAQAAPGSSLPVEVIHSYFTQAIEYSMTDSHRAGLEGFRVRCTKNKLL
jgi:chorismate dehydratase